MSSEVKYNILITGANGAVGSYLSSKFLKEGHYVLEHLGHTQYDLRNKNDINMLVENAKQKNINVLINNAAINCPGIDLVQYKDEMILDMINVNLIAPILLTHHLLPQLTNIININSMVGLEIKRLRTIYSATKWGLRGFSQSLKAENNNITILDVYSTNIKTTPEKNNAMEINFVINKIYDAFINKKEILILDGRKGTTNV